MSNIIQLGEEYLYTTIPKDYVYVYYSILTMLAELGEDMLKDCKATCKDRNSGIIECKNMFDAAIAARKLGNIKLADTIIKYLKAKINQILGTKNEFISYSFPVNGGDAIKYIVDTNNNPIIKIDETNAESYKDNLIDIVNNCITSLNTNFNINCGQRTLLESDNGYLMNEDNHWYMAKGEEDAITINIQSLIYNASYKILKDGIIVTDDPNYALFVPSDISEDCTISTEVIDGSGIIYRKNFDIEFIYAAYYGVGESYEDVGDCYPIVKYEKYIKENAIVTSSGNSGYIIVVIPAFYTVNNIYIKNNEDIIYPRAKTLVRIHDIDYISYDFQFTPGTTYDLYVNA